ncbi:TPA: phage tail protein, partial [Streptococcus pyogenes]|nr:phage tail protein [Streptococcus pyogenes]
MNKNDTKNVTSAKPKTGGAIYSAPLGAKLPENATD